MKTPSIILGPDSTGRVLETSYETIHSFGPPAVQPKPESLAIPCPGGRIEPGRVNAHTHVYSGLVPFGLPAPAHPPENFVQILERIWWRLDRALDEKSLRAAARYYVAEALLAGTTTLIDHHESPALIGGSLDILADACDELGVRAVLCYGATERNGGRNEARRGLEECRRFLLGNWRAGVRGLVGLHASFTVSDVTIREAGTLCRELDVPLHIHLAEDVADLHDSRARGYPGPLERLVELDALPPGSILAHGVHLTRDQVRLAAQRKCWLVQNPRSNRGNNVGYPQALHETSRVAVGTDGYPARMADETEALAEEAARHGEDPEVVRRRTLAGYEMTRELFGVSFAPLEAGGAADITVFEGSELRHLLVGGRLIVRDGRLLTGNREDIAAEAREEASRLWARMDRL